MGTSLSVHALVGRNKECKGTRDPTLRCTPSNGPHPPPPLSNKEQRSSPHCTVANSESKILHRFNGRVGWRTFAPPPYSRAHAPLCMPRVCCSLICFSTPLRTVDCVQYNPVLWPTLASLLLLQSSDFTGARKWRQWAPPPTAPQLLLCTPRTPPDMTNDPRCRWWGCRAWETGSWPPLHLGIVSGVLGGVIRMIHRPASRCCPFLAAEVARGD